MPTIVATATASWSSGTSVVVDLPSGSAAGDGVELFTFCHGTGRTSGNSQGLTKVEQVTFDFTGTDFDFVFSCFHKILTSGDVSRGTFTITHTGGGSPAFAGGAICAIRGVDPAGPQVLMETAFDSSGTSHSATDETGQITTTRDGALISVIAGDEQGALSYTPPVGWTEDYDSAGAAFFHIIQATAGATGAINFTSGIAGQVLCCTFAWQPPPTPVPVFLHHLRQQGMS